eukprot:scaffold65873_cov43-Tisochrysis_lutea.AAC.4
MPCGSWCSSSTCDQPGCSSCSRSMCNRRTEWEPSQTSDCQSWCDGAAYPSHCLSTQCLGCGRDHGCPERVLPSPLASPASPAPPPSPPTVCAPPGTSEGNPNCIVDEWRCCEQEGLTCWRLNGRGRYGYGQCRESCPDGWDCEAVTKLSPPPPPLPLPDGCAEWTARYGTCIDSPSCCQPGDGCYRRIAPRHVAICRPLPKHGACVDTDEWTCPDNWIFWMPLPSPPPPPPPTARRPAGLQPAAAGRGGGGSLAPAAASALGAWAGLSPADQWLLVIIFALCGLIGLLLYAWCSGRAARASTARRGRQQMLDSDKGGAPSGPSVPASSLPRAASSQPEHEAGPSSDDEASPVPTADGIAVNIEMRPQCSRVVP